MEIKVYELNLKINNDKVMFGDKTLYSVDAGKMKGEIEVRVSHGRAIYAKQNLNIDWLKQETQDKIKSLIEEIENELTNI